jgi:hypothetical protein
LATCERTPAALQTFVTTSSLFGLQPRSGPKTGGHAHAWCVRVCDDVADAEVFQVGKVFRRERLVTNDYGRFPALLTVALDCGVKVMGAFPVLPKVRVSAFTLVLRLSSSGQSGSNEQDCLAFAAPQGAGGVVWLVIEDANTL